MNLFLEILLTLGLIFLLTKKIAAVSSITFQEKKSKPFIIIAFLIFVLILVIGFYFSESILHYFMSLLGASVIILDPYTSGISTETNEFIRSERSEVLFLSFPERVKISNVSKIKISDVSADVFSITYFFNKRYNRLTFSSDKKNEILELLEI